MKQALVILRGAPESGKTTLGERLRSKESKVVWLKIDNLKPFFSEDWGDSLDEVNKIALTIIDQLLADGFSVVFDGIFKNPDHALEAVRLAKSKNIPVVVYQLKCSLETLQKRENVRSKTMQRGHFGKDMIERLYYKVLNNPIDGAIMLDTENKSLEKCLGIIRKNFS